METIDHLLAEAIWTELDAHTRLILALIECGENPGYDEDDVCYIIAHGVYLALVVPAYAPFLAQIHTAVGSLPAAVVTSVPADASAQARRYAAWLWYVERLEAYLLAPADDPRRDLFFALVEAAKALFGTSKIRWTQSSGAE
jgi:hypothetical protein